jgi:hypothetical protein
LVRSGLVLVIAFAAWAIHPGIHAGAGLTPAEVNDKELRMVLDADGLPNLGVTLKPGDPMYNYIDEEHGTSRRQVYRGEPATVERVSQP